jgi:hypothetical protein
MSSIVCWKCFDDEYLSKIVKKDGERLRCSVCRKTRKAFTVERLGELLEPILEQHIKRGRQIGDQEDGYEQSGDDLSFWVQEVVGECHGLEQEIVDAVMDAEHVDPRDGDVAFFDESENYESVGVSISEYLSEWHLVEKELQSARRFFSSRAKNLFDRLFRDVETMKSWSVETRQYESVVRIFPEGSKIYRARKIDRTQLEHFYNGPLRFVGPPTSPFAGRMNVEGVVVFYGAMDYKTCLAEMRPPLGGTTAVIAVENAIPLTLLDFTRLEKSHRILSYFQPDFSAEAERNAFLRHLHTIVSQPVIPGRESDYLITQTLAEYLAHVHKYPLDGILFRSVQRKDGVNIVLFAKGEGDGKTSASRFPLRYVDDSFKVYSTEAIEYEHSEKRVIVWDETVCFEYEQDEWYDNL